MIRLWLGRALRARLDSYITCVLCVLIITTASKHHLDPHNIYRASRRADMVSCQLLSDGQSGFAISSSLRWKQDDGVDERMKLCTLYIPPAALTALSTSSLTMTTGV